MRAGAKFPGSHVLVYYRLQRHGKPLLGITVSKKYGKAHERNRFKRIVREAFRHCQHQLPRGIELNVMPLSKMCRDIDPSSIIKDFILLTKKIEP